mmetsp:Transcript_76779/g.220498  ORF Transcript_76779/g.220498 Transcript_76779/m.220498 type:complete len:201 (+) Transcript_76779:2205-2807(+)
MLKREGRRRVRLVLNLRSDPFGGLGVGIGLDRICRNDSGDELGNLLVGDALFSLKLARNGSLDLSFERTLFQPHLGQLVRSKRAAHTEAGIRIGVSVDDECITVVAFGLRLAGLTPARRTAPRTPLGPAALSSPTFGRRERGQRWRIRGKRGHTHAADEASVGAWARFQWLAEQPLAVANSLLVGLPPPCHCGQPVALLP